MTDNTYPANETNESAELRHYIYQLCNYLRDGIVDPQTPYLHLQLAANDIAATVDQFTDYSRLTE